MESKNFGEIVSIDLACEERSEYFTESPLFEAGVLSFLQEENNTIEIKIVGMNFNRCFIKISGLKVKKKLLS
jgi:hypothetical protein